MTQSRFLKIALAAILVPSFAVLALPEGVWPAYADIVEPVSLAAGAVLALWVSFSYRKDLKAAFLCLSLFLLIYSLAIVLFLSYRPLLLPQLSAVLTLGEIVTLVQSVQFINYAMLFLFCVYILRVIDVTKLNRKGWSIFSASAVSCALLALYPVAPLISNIWREAIPDGAHMAIRVLDGALITILTPVLWLYVQHLRSQQRQSFSFTLIIFGIIFFTLFDYLYELLTVVFPGIIPQGSALASTIPEALFIYGYLMIAVGLYAHHRDDAWGYQAIDRAISGELKLVDFAEDEVRKT